MNPPRTAPEAARSCLRATLQPHPVARVPVPLSVEAEATVAPDGTLILRYRVAGEVERLRLPPPEPPAFRDGLWRHTCLEAFLMPAAGPAYVEYNFATSGCWAAWGFSAERVRDARTPARAPVLTVTRALAALELVARVPADTLPLPPGSVRLGLAAVLECEDGSLSWWAVAHPSHRPDFHHPGAFVLNLDLPAHVEAGT